MSACADARGNLMDDDARLDDLLREARVNLVPHAHQRDAIRWWTDTEGGTDARRRGTCSGGILGDDMGLGKSMSAVMASLIGRAIDLVLNKEACFPLLACACAVTPTDENNHHHHQHARGPDTWACALETAVRVYRPTGLGQGPICARSRAAGDAMPSGCASGGMVAALMRGTVNARNAMRTSLPVRTPGRAGSTATVLTPTLIVCPKSLLRQWQSEILAHTTLLADDDVLAYHGRTSRRALNHRLHDSVFVITTYETVLAAHERAHAERASARHPVRAPFDWSRVPPPDNHCDGQVAKGKESDGTGQMCRPNGGGGTHVPDHIDLLLLEQRMQQLASAPIRRTGAKRKRSVSYNTAASDNDVGGNRDDGGEPLFTIQWDRVILDEAHTIRNWHGSKTHRAVSALKAQRRWCLTGTAFNNGLSDIVALCRFIRITPHDDPKWWADANDDAVALWHKRFFLRRLKRQHPSDALTVERTIPSAKRADSPMHGQPSEKAQRQTVLMGAPFGHMLPLTDDVPHVMRERTAETRSDGGHCALSLPAKIERVRRVSLNDREEAIYLQLVCRALAVHGTPDPSNRETDDDGQQTTADSVGCLDAVGCILEWITRLRQAVCDPLVLRGRGATIAYAPMAQRERAHRVAACVACPLSYDRPTRSGAGDSDLAHLPCTHRMCADCVARDGTLQCPLCHPHRDADMGTAPNDPKRQGLPFGTKRQPARGPSSRTASMIRFLNKILRRDTHCKVVIFSQWSTYLDLIECAVATRVGVGYVRIDGDVRGVDERNGLVRQFTSDADTRCLLMTYGVGSVGLNLMCATYVLLMDAHYNPAVEAQAIDRVHRIGQTRPVRVVRFCSDASIGAAISGLQARKRAQAEVFLRGRSLNPRSDDSTKPKRRRRLCMEGVFAPRGTERDLDERGARLVLQSIAAAAAAATFASRGANNNNADDDIL